ncbi:hypothetical protein TMP445_80038 [Tenacibaculum maritimum]|nr:hypothetical protein TMP445_80038 [Tenacibaculum maritimum]
MKQQFIQVKIGGLITFEDLGELDKFTKSKQFKSQNFEYVGGKKHVIKRIS